MQSINILKAAPRKNLNLVIVGRFANFEKFDETLRAIKRKYVIGEIFLVGWEVYISSIRRFEKEFMERLEINGSVTKILVEQSDVLLPQDFQRLLDIDEKGFRYFFHYNYLFRQAYQHIVSTGIEWSGDWLLLRPDLVVRHLPSYNNTPIFLDEIPFVNDNFKLSDKCLLCSLDDFRIRSEVYETWLASAFSYSDISCRRWRDIPAEERYLLQFAKNRMWRYQKASGFSYINRGVKRKIKADINDVVVAAVRLFYPHFRLPLDKR